MSIANWPNVDVVDMSAMTSGDMESFKSVNNPLGLAGVIDKYDTFVFDSLTNVTYKALLRAVEMYAHHKDKPTAENPGKMAYGARNVIVLQLVKNVLAFTGKHNKHCIFIAHENSPVLNDDGVVLFITIAVGGKLPDQTAVDFSEVWNLYDRGVGRNRRIMIRPSRGYKPCKTRMFKTTGETEFDWYFSPDELDDPHNMTIAGWYAEYVEGGKNKLELPEAPKKPKLNK
jgi:hypothetical protein